MSTPDLVEQYVKIDIHPMITKETPKMEESDDVIQVDGIVEEINNIKTVDGVEICELDEYDCRTHDFCYGYISYDEINLNFVTDDYTISALIDNYNIANKMSRTIKIKLVKYTSDSYNGHIGVPEWFKARYKTFYSFINYVREQHWERLIIINEFPKDACDISGLPPSRLLNIMAENPLRLYSDFPSLALMKDLLMPEQGGLVRQEDLNILSGLNDGDEYDESLPKNVMLMYGWEVVSDKPYRSSMIKPDKLYRSSVIIKSGEIRNFFASLRGINLDMNTDGLNEDQKNAMLSTESRISVIGGPGTGKSFFIERYVDSLQEQGISYFVLALSAVAVDNLDRSPDFKGSTIHMARYYSYQLSTAQVVIVEEVSMVDLTRLWWIAMRAKNCRKIIFVGDKDQIPPPGGMSVISSLLGGCYVYELKECMRRIEPIVEFGSMTFRSLFNNDHIDILPYNMNVLLPLLTEYYLDCHDNLIMATTNNIVDGLNNMINKEINGRGNNIKMGSKVSCRKNDYEYKILNGQDFIVVNFDHGYYTLQSTAESRKDKLIKIPVSVFESHFTLGYVRTISRAQGKESDSVIIIIPAPDRVLTKKTLYTAITRTRGRVIICTNIAESYVLLNEELPECPIFSM